MVVELKENELGSIPEKYLSVGGADFGGSAVFAVGPRICHSSQSPFTPIGILVDQNHQIVCLDVTSRARPLLSLMQRRNVLFLPDVPKGVDAAFGYIGRRGRDDRCRGMLHHRWVKEVGRSERLAVPWVGADGR